uniref:Uncharacterized protein n=1 Tax=Macaca fascicularis TaxID=9541 RepID=A0A7N9D728_MACFA
MTPPTAILYPSITTQNSPASSGCPRIFPSPHRHQSILSIRPAAPLFSPCFQARFSSSCRSFESNIFGSPRLWYNHNRRCSFISGPRDEALGLLGVWGGSEAGSAWAAGLAQLRVFRKFGSCSGSWSLRTPDNLRVPSERKGEDATGVILFNAAILPISLTLSTTQY